MTRAHFKFMAKHQLRGNIGTLFLGCLLFSLAMIALLAIPAVLYFVLPKELGVVTYFIIAGVGSLIMLFYSFFAFPAFNIGYIMMIQKIASSRAKRFAQERSSAASSVSGRLSRCFSLSVCSAAFGLFFS